MDWICDPAATAPPDPEGGSRRATRTCLATPAIVGPGTAASIPVGEPEFGPGVDFGPPAARHAHDADRIAAG